MRLIADQIGLRLLQRCLVRAGIDLSDQTARMDRLTFDESDLLDRPRHLGMNGNRIIGNDGADSGQDHRLIGNLNLCLHNRNRRRGGWQGGLGRPAFELPAEENNYAKSGECNTPACEFTHNDLQQDVALSLRRPRFGYGLRPHLPDPKRRWRPRGCFSDRRRGH